VSGTPGSLLTPKSGAETKTKANPEKRAFLPFVRPLSIFSPDQEKSALPFHTEKKGYKYNAAAAAVFCLSLLISAHITSSNSTILLTQMNKFTLSQVPVPVPVLSPQ
jgi:hypothetical protein